MHSYLWHVGTFQRLKAEPFCLGIRKMLHPQAKQKNVSLDYIVINNANALCCFFLLQFFQLCSYLSIFPYIFLAVNI